MIAGGCQCLRRLSMKRPKPAIYEDVGNISIEGLSFANIRSKIIGQDLNQLEYFSFFLSGTESPKYMIYFTPKTIIHWFVAHHWAITSQTSNILCWWFWPRTSAVFLKRIARNSEMIAKYHIISIVRCCVFRTRQHSNSIINIPNT
jgi:hypothetical protein